MKKLQSKVITLSIAMILIGNLQAMSPTMRQLVQERGMARKWEEAEAERMADPSLRIKNIYQRLGLPRGWDKEKLTAPTVSPLMELFDDDEIVEIIQSWRNEGHLFPDERFHPGSVSNAIVKYGANLFRIPLSDVDRYLFQFEPIYQIGGEEYPQSAIYAMTPEEHGKLLIPAAEDPANIDILQKLIEWDADVNSQDNFSRTALMWAAASDNTEAIRALLEAGADPNIQDKFGYTALIVAAKKNNAEAVRALLSAQGIDPNIQSKLGETALIWAAEKNNTEALRALLDAPGIDVNRQDNFGNNRQDNFSNTPLIWAAKNNNTAAVQALLAAGADPNLQDRDGNTALIWTTIWNNTAAIQALLDAPGIDLNLQHYLMLRASI